MGLWEQFLFLNVEPFFIRGCIEIPVLDGEGAFIWDVWVSLSETNFEKTIEYWETEGRENELVPMIGWLSISILVIKPYSLWAKRYMSTFEGKNRVIRLCKYEY
mgnify:CR=1 FL=1